MSSALALPSSFDAACGTQRERAKKEAVDAVSEMHLQTQKTTLEEAIERGMYIRAPSGASLPGWLASAALGSD